MGIEILVALFLLLVAGYIIFKFIKKIIVALFTLTLVTALIVIGLGVLLYKDIQTYREHETKAVLLLVTDQSGATVQAAAAFEPMKQKTERADAASTATQGDADSDTKEFRLFSSKEVKGLTKLIEDDNIDSLLKDYFKIALFRPSSIRTLLVGKATIFEMSFSPEEIEKIIEDKDPQSFLVKKSLKDKTMKLRNLMKMFSSDAEIKGSLFFGALFDQMRKDQLLAAVGLIKSYHRDEITIEKETLVFRLIKISPVEIARKLIQTVSEAFGEGNMKIPSFGSQEMVESGENDEL